MANYGEYFMTEGVNRSDKKIVASREDLENPGVASAEAKSMRREDINRMREFYEYCERIIAAQYAMWKENSKLRS